MKEHKQGIIKELSIEYRIDLNIVRRLAILNDYDVDLVMEQLQIIHEKQNKIKPTLFTQDWLDYTENNNIIEI